MIMQEYLLVAGQINFVFQSRSKRFTHYERRVGAAPPLAGLWERLEEEGWGAEIQQATPPALRRAWLKNRGIGTGNELTSSN
jgi:hypothetical protein